MHAIYDVLPSGLYVRFFLAGREKLLSGIATFLLYHTHTSKDKNPFLYFDACTVHIVQLIIQNNKYTIYINNILHIVSIPTYFDASASSSGSLILLLC